MARYLCAWRTAHTPENLGKGELPPRCVAKGCNGGPFRQKPLCETFIQDKTVPAGRVCRRRLAPWSPELHMERIKAGQIPMDVQMIVKVNAALLNKYKIETRVEAEG